METLADTNGPVTATEVLDRTGDVAPRLGHVIGGVTEPPGAELLDVVDPCSGGLLAQVTSGTPADVDRAVAAARAALPAWRALTPADRAGVLNAVAAAVDAHLDELIALESRNVGKPHALAADEIPGVGEVMRF